MDAPASASARPTLRRPVLSSTAAAAAAATAATDFENPPAPLPPKASTPVQPAASSAAPAAAAAPTARAGGGLFARPPPAPTQQPRAPPQAAAAAASSHGLPRPARAPAPQATASLTPAAAEGGAPDAPAAPPSAAKPLALPPLALPTRATLAPPAGPRDDEGGDEDDDADVSSLGGGAGAVPGGAAGPGSARSSRAHAHWRRVFTAIRFAHRGGGLSRDSLGSSVSAAAGARCSLGGGSSCTSGADSSAGRPSPSSLSARGQQRQRGQPMMALVMGLESDVDMGAADTPRYYSPGSAAAAGGGGCGTPPPAASPQPALQLQPLFQSPARRRRPAAVAAPATGAGDFASPPASTTTSEQQQQQQQQQQRRRRSSSLALPLAVSPTRLAGRGRGSVRALAAAIDTRRAASSDDAVHAAATPTRASHRGGTAAAAAAATPGRGGTVAAGVQLFSSPNPNLTLAGVQLFSSPPLGGAGAGAPGGLLATPRRLIADYKASAFTSSGSTLDGSNRSLDVLDVAAAAASGAAGGGLYGPQSTKLRVMVSAAMAGKAAAARGNAALGRGGTYGDAVRDGLRQMMMTPPLLHPPAHPPAAPAAATPAARSGVGVVGDSSDSSGSEEEDSLSQPPAAAATPAQPLRHRGGAGTPGAAPVAAVAQPALIAPGLQQARSPSPGKAAQRCPAASRLAAGSPPPSHATKLQLGSASKRRASPPPPPLGSVQSSVCSPMHSSGSTGSDVSPGWMARPTTVSASAACVPPLGLLPGTSSGGCDTGELLAAVDAPSSSARSEEPPLQLRVGGAAPPPPAPCGAATNGSGARRRPPSSAAAARLSHCANEDGYDFAIVVRALSSTASPEQVAALARAKAAADALQAAALQQAALLSGGTAAGTHHGAGAVLLGAAALASHDVERGLLPAAHCGRDSIGTAARGAPPQQLQRAERASDGSSSTLSSAAAAVGRVLRSTASSLSMSSRGGHGATRKPRSGRRGGGGGAGGQSLAAGSKLEGEADSASSSDSDAMSDSTDEDDEEDEDEESLAAPAHGALRRTQSAASPLPPARALSSGGRRKRDDYDDSDEDDSDASELREDDSIFEGEAHGASGVAARRRSPVRASRVGAASAGASATHQAAARARRVTFGALPAASGAAAASSLACDSTAGTAVTVAVAPAPPTVGSSSGSGGGAKAKKASTCAEILHALRSAGLQAKRVRSLSRRTWLIKLRAPEWRLEIEAEKVKLRLRRVDGGWSKFRRSARHLFAPIELSARELEGGAGYALFHSSDRQTLLHHILQSESREGGADLGVGSPLGAYVTLMFPLHMTARLQELRSDWLALWRPPRSQPAADRIGWVDPAWYDEPQLVDISELMARAAAAAAVAGSASPASAHPSGGGSSSTLPSKSAGAAPPMGSSSHTLAGYVAAVCGMSDAGALPPSLAAAPHGKTMAVPPTTSSSNSSSSSSSSSSALPIRGVLCLARCGGRALRSAGRLVCGLLSQPLDRIAAYFGEHVAFYFAWLEFYTRWLVLPALGGIFLFVAQLYHGSLDIAYSPLFSLCMAVWSIAFLEAWKRRNAELAQRWGVLAFEAEEVTRPQFAGAWKLNSLTGEVLRVYPTHKWVLKYAVTVPTVLALIFSMLATMMMVFSTRDHVLAQFNRHRAAAELHAAALGTIADGLARGALSPAAAAALTAALPTLPPAVDLAHSFNMAWAGGLGGFLSGQAALGDDALAAGGMSYGDARAAAGDGGSFDLTDAARFFSPATWASKLRQLTGYFGQRGDWQWWLAMVLPPVFFGLLMPLFEAAFSAVAARFNDWENHATDSSHRNHLIAKIFCFRFVASFISLFYYAFSPQHSLLQLAVQLGTFMIVGQLYRQTLETCLPRTKRALRECRFRRRVRQAEDSGVTEGKRGRRLVRHAISQAWAEARMPRYDTFNDYAELLIQFGYVTFFSWAFPLAPLCALINNVIEMRADAYKLCYTSQRPIAAKAGGIGVWYNVMVFMALLAVLTNSAHLALTSRQFRAYFPGMSDSERMLVVFLVEHVVLGLRLLLPWVVPELPRPVRNRLVRDAVSAARLAAATRHGAGAGKGGLEAGGRPAPDAVAPA